MYVANESGITKGARHFHAKVHYLREVIEFGDIKLEKVHIDDNLADPFTKALAFPKHSELTRNIGMLPAMYELSATPTPKWELLDYCSEGVCDSPCDITTSGYLVYGLTRRDEHWNSLWLSSGRSQTKDNHKSDIVSSDIGQQRDLDLGWFCISDRTGFLLIGERREYAIRVLECCGFHAKNGLKVLEQKSLIIVDECGFLRMHDHIEEMGKNIVRRSHPDEPYQHSRLWIDDEIEDILANDMGTKKTRCLKLNMGKGDLRILMKGLGKMINLRYLEVLQKLKFLSLSESKLRTFDLGLTPNLETLSIDNCANFEELHVHVACPNLKFLNLRRSRLRSLDLELIPNLEKLDLKYCNELVEINAPVGCLNKVVELNLRGCALIEKLPEDLGRFGCIKRARYNNTVIRDLPQSYWVKSLLSLASFKLLQLYDFPLKTTTRVDLHKSQTV
ncbi:Toll/interleukin-1 receptor domain-containing protein [Tanacetum coccineum]